MKSGIDAARQLTHLNQELLGNKTIAEVEPFTFVSNDNRFEVEAYLTKPLGMTAASLHPLIVVIHGGPHGANGSWFNFKNHTSEEKEDHPWSGDVPGRREHHLCPHAAIKNRRSPTTLRFSPREETVEFGTKIC